jgi:hypothetical protein
MAVDLGGDSGSVLARSIGTPRCGLAHE